MRIRRMCVSAATLNLQQARKLEWRDTDSDEEDDLPSSKTFLGLPLDGLEEEIGSQEASSPALSFSSHRSNAHRLAAEVEHQLNQLQQVLLTKLSNFCPRHDSILSSAGADALQ